MKIVTAALAVFMLIFAFASSTNASNSSRTFFAPAVCVDTRGEEACLEGRKGDDIGIVCVPVGPMLCCKQVVVSFKSTKGKECVDCEDRCDGIEDSNKRDKCFNKCEKQNEGCDGGSSSAKLTEVGDTMSCALFD